MISYNYSYSFDMKYLSYSLSCYLIQDKDITPKEVALQREGPFPFIIVEGTLDAPEDFYLAAETEVLCTFKGNLIEATLGLLASYYVFMYNYPPSLNSFFCTYRNAS